MARAVDGFAKEARDLAERLVRDALPALAQRHPSLLLEQRSVRALREEAHLVAQDPQPERKATGWERGGEARVVERGDAPEVHAARGRQQSVEATRRDVERGLAHHLQDQERCAARRGWLVCGPCAVAQADGHDGRARVLLQDDGQPVWQAGLVDRDARRSCLVGERRA